MEPPSKESIMADLDKDSIQIEEPEEVVELSLADSIGAAMDAHEEGEADATPAEPVADDASEGEPDGGTDDPVSEATPDEPEIQEADDGSTGLDTAPNSLPPAAREAWKDAPTALKEAVAKREKDYEKGILKYSADAKRATEMDSALKPFEQYLGMNGGNAHIGDLLRTGAGLQMGSPIQKAEQIAGLISQFGVDINTLDGILSGNGASAPVQQQDAVQKAVEAALQPYQEMMQKSHQREQASEQQSQQQVSNEITTFSSDPANEFYNDVRQDMADILDAGAKHGTEMTLKQAYDRACLIHPEISSVITARNAQQDIGAKRNAASSISGTRSGVNTSIPTGSIRDTIDAVWDNVGGRV
jgi:hypothetical protein